MPIEVYLTAAIADLEEIRSIISNAVAAVENPEFTPASYPGYTAAIDAAISRIHAFKEDIRQHIPPVPGRKAL